MLKKIRQTNPHADFLISDFSSFDQMSLETENSLELNCPKIATKRELAAEKTSFRSTLDPPIGTSDIFYATDFDFLRFLFEKVFGKKVALLWV